MTSIWDSLVGCEQPSWLDSLSRLRPNAVLEWNIPAGQATLASLWGGNSCHCSFKPVCFSCSCFGALENWIKLQSHFLPNTKVQNEEHISSKAHFSHIKLDGMVLKWALPGVCSVA